MPKLIFLNLKAQLIRHARLFRSLFILLIWLLCAPYWLTLLGIVLTIEKYPASWLLVCAVITVWQLAWFLIASQWMLKQTTQSWLHLGFWLIYMVWFWFLPYWAVEALPMVIFTLCTTSWPAIKASIRQLRSK